MKLARVIGRVVLSKKDPSLAGGMLVVASPLDRNNYADKSDTTLSKTQYNLIVYDNLGATLGDVIGYVEGAEATAAFTRPIAIDAYNVGIVDRFNVNFKNK